MLFDIIVAFRRNLELSRVDIESYRNTFESGRLSQVSSKEMYVEDVRFEELIDVLDWFFDTFGEDINYDKVSISYEEYMSFPYVNAMNSGDVINHLGVQLHINEFWKSVGIRCYYEEESYEVGYGIFDWETKKEVDYSNWEVKDGDRIKLLDMPFDKDGKHSTGWEVYDSTTDRWCVEYEA